MSRTMSGGFVGVGRPRIRSAGPLGSFVRFLFKGVYRGYYEGSIRGTMFRV